MLGCVTFLQAVETAPGRLRRPGGNGPVHALPGSDRTRTALCGRGPVVPVWAGPTTRRAFDPSAGESCIHCAGETAGRAG